MICRNCNKEVPEGVRFCPGCGSRTDAAQNSENTGPAHETVLLLTRQQKEASERNAALEQQLIRQKEEADRKLKQASTGWFIAFLIACGSMFLFILTLL